jgi:hypothetical protein
VQLEDVGDAQREAEDYAEYSDPVEISQVYSLVTRKPSVAYHWPYIPAQKPISRYLMHLTGTAAY